MLQSLIITLREGVEAALILGIVLAYLARVERKRMNAAVWWGFVSAVVASLGAAFVVHRFEVAEEKYEGWLMLAGAVFVGSMVAWMWRTGKRMKQEIESHVARWSGETGRGAAIGLFLFVFLMVLREGIETALFLAAVSLRTSDLANFIGGVTGLGLAAGLGVAFFKGSVKVDLKKFFAVTSLVLMVIAGQLLISGIHELSEGGILPSSRTEMALVGRVVNNDAFFFVIVVALSTFLVFAQHLREQTASAEGSGAPSNAERRKALAERRRERFWRTAAGAVGLVTVILLTGEFIYSRQAQAMTPAEPLSVRDGVARIPVAQLADRKLHRYAVKAGGGEVRLIAILDSTDAVRVGLDACMICGSQGYTQDGPNVICRNCAAAIYVPTIGLAGGCNPIHIPYTVEGDAATVSEVDLAGATKYFH